MKTSEILILAGAAGFAFWLLKVRKPAASTVQPATKGAAGTGSIFSRDVLNTATPGEAGWGWKYYDDGTAIGPDGTYYKNGVAVWAPAP